MQYRFFTDSTRAWQAMYSAIERSENSILLEIYIFHNDMQKYNFFELLIKKAKQGVKVHLVLDYVGSFALNKKAVAELEGAGIEVIFSSHIFHRIHRKILIVDETIAYMGGVNLKQDTFFWKDLMVEIKNKKLVGKLLRTFARFYVSVGGKDEYLKSKNKKLKIDNAKNWMVEHIPEMRKFSLKRIYKEALNKAEKKVTIITPYFAPKRWLRAVLHQAVIRGVEVEVIVPYYVDWFIPDRANYFYMNKMSGLGVKVYTEPFMNHAKVLIIDGKRALIGSQNIDFLSFDYNSEIGVFFEESRVVGELEKIAEKWKGKSNLFDPKTYKPHWYDYLLAPLISIFSKVF